MNKSTVKSSPAPEGYSTVCPYLMVEDVKTTLDFLQHVFNAETKETVKEPSGEIMHGEARIGDSVIMIGKAAGSWPADQSSLYVFVNNADEVYERALKYGASSLMEPGDRFYGLREGGIKDSQGNQWWMAHEIEKVSIEVMEQRLAEMKAKS